MPLTCFSSQMHRMDKHNSYSCENSKLWGRFLLKLQFSIRKYGFLGFCEQIIMRTIAALAQNAEVLFSVDAADIDPHAVVLDGMISVESFTDIDKIRSQDLEKLALHMGSNGLLRRELRRFFSRRGVFWLARYSGEPAGFHWSIRAGMEGFYFFPMYERDAVLVSSQVFPEFRGRGVNPQMIQHILVELKKEGVTRMYISCKVDNKANLRSIPKTSFRRIGTVREFRFFGRRLLYWSRISI